MSQEKFSTLINNEYSEKAHTALLHLVNTLLVLSKEARQDFISENRATLQILNKMLNPLHYLS